MVPRMTENRRTIVTILVESSSLHAVGYAPETKSLRVTFRNGSTYRYFDVPYEVFQDLLHANSKGRYFNDSIRPAFRYERLP